MSEQRIPRVSPDQTKALIANDGAVVIDVRETHELARTGKVAGALHIPSGDIQTLDLDRDTPVVLYCAAGERSEISGLVLKAIGYRKVYNLGGFRDWISAGGAIENI